MLVTPIQDGIIPRIPVDIELYLEGRTMQRKIIAVVAFLIILLSSFCAQADFSSCFIDARICNCKQYATLRSWPSPNAPEIKKVYLGEEVTILSREAHKDSDMDFVFVETLDYEVGYIWLNCIMAIGVEGDEDYGGDIGYGYITAKNNLHSNLRSGPGLNYPAIAYLFGGEAIPYLGRKEKDKDGRVWYCCEVDDTVCWISSKVADLYRN